MHKHNQFDSITSVNLLFNEVSKTGDNNYLYRYLKGLHDEPFDGGTNDEYENRSNELIEEVKGINIDEKYVFDFDKYPYEDFNEIVIQAFYVWNSDNIQKNSYSKFVSEVENCGMTKDLILTKYKAESHDSTFDSSSSFDFDRILDME